LAPEIKIKNQHNQHVILDADKLEDFKKAISPLEISSYFRRVQYDIVEEYNKNKERKDDYIINFMVDDKQTTLDLYKIHEKDINSHISNIDDTKTLMEMRDKAEIVLSSVRYRLNSLRKRI